MPKPVGVPNSVFDLPAAQGRPADPAGRPQAKEKRKRPTRLDPDAVKVEVGVPIPPRGTERSVYALLADRMQVGTMVRLATQQANGLVAYLKSRELPHVRRRVAEGVYGVWRTEKWPSDEDTPEAPATKKAAAKPGKAATHNKPRR